ncbi:MAG: sugar transferase, partial [Chloroflexota bacterium]|nr:sugar transferase [Chloroflexota bacterium]
MRECIGIVRSNDFSRRSARNKRLKSRLRTYSPIIKTLSEGSGVLYPGVKRFIDVVGGLVGLGVTALVYVPIALAIKLDSRGSVVFAQDRVGKDERVFRLYKFRTMYLNSGRHGLKPGPNDERVTRVGRFLRRTSLDELPQFFNILRGEMSLVGPRP